MCGIAGVWPDQDVEDSHQGLVSDMLGRLAHRGPDGAGQVALDGGVLGHRRLAIVDVEGGAQPLALPSEGLYLVGNGELYDAPQLRPRLARSRPFATRSDNEVALHLHAQHGREVASHLDGMFALALSDGKDLLLLRDPVGIKPLYLGRQGEATVFASELKALPSGTCQVRPVTPGETWASRGPTPPPVQLPDPPVRHDPPESHVAAVRHALEQAVERRLMGDVPVGAFLSGGLDSSAIAAIAARRTDELHTFTVGTPDSPDLAAARAVAAHIGSVHHERILDADDLRRVLPRVLWALESYDADLVRSAVPTYVTAGLAAEHVKVVLTGEGADELFAGYRYMADIATDRLPAELRRSVRALHAVNLQRVDRMSMAHGLEARVPFLDTQMITTALAVPPELVHATGTRPEKWVLRAAVEDLLPHDVVWRGKEQFGDGSGASDLLPHLAADLVGAADGIEDPEDEEAVYRRLLAASYDDPQPILDNVVRWTDGRTG